MRHVRSIKNATRTPEPKPDEVPLKVEYYVIYNVYWHNKIPDLIWGLKSSCVMTYLSHIPVDQENTGKTTSTARKQLFATSSRKARAALLPRGNQNNQRVSSLSPHSQRHSEKCYSKGKNASLLQEKEGLLLKTCFSLSNQSQSTAFAEEVKVPLTYPHLLFAISFMYQQDM